LLIAVINNTSLVLYQISMMWK